MPDPLGNASFPFLDDFLQEFLDGVISSFKGFKLFAAVAGKGTREQKKAGS